MRLRDFLSRIEEEGKSKTTISKKDVICDSKKLKELIKKWTESEGWKFENFAEFIRLAGVETPVILSKLNKENEEFKCTTALGTELTIKLYFGKWDFASGIYVIDGDKTNFYAINTKSVKVESAPEITLQRRSIKRREKELDCFYSKYFFRRTLYIGESEELTIEIDEPEKYKEKGKIKVLQNCENIEEYLLGLEEPINVHVVYAKMMEFLMFSSYDIQKCECILIRHENIENGENHVQKLYMNNGRWK